MPTNAEQLELIRSEAYARLAENLASPKPSYNLDGQQVSWTKYKASLWDDIHNADAQLASIAPYEIHSQGVT
jgi:hypothetical protein